MKKFLIFAVCLISLNGLISCSKTGDCDGFCERKNVKLHSYKSGNEKLNLCEDCYNILKAIDNLSQSSKN